ncbi:AarF/ABC1/UbiB kinase family protein, partial [Candidatus Woesearchaeota archaeon]
DAVTKQILVDKIFHADPHPGNIFLLRNNRIAFLDFGIVGIITEDMEREIEDFVIGVVTKDIDLLIRSIISTGSISEDIDMKSFKADLSEALAVYYGRDIKQINLGSLFMTTFKMAQRYHIKLPINYTLLGKSLITLEGIGHKYFPEFNYFEYMKPKVKDLVKKRYGASYILSSMKETAIDFRDLIRNFPSDVAALIRALKYGTKIKLDVEQDEMRIFAKELDKSSNRVTAGLILAALIMGSSLLTAMKVPPMIGNVPVVVYIMLIFIIIISISLIISMLRDINGGEL